MKLNMHIEILDASPSELQFLMGCLAAESAPKTYRRADGSYTTEGTMDDPHWPAEMQQVSTQSEMTDDEFDQPPRTAPGQAGADDRPPVDEVIASVANKRAQTVSLAGEAKGKEGDEVQTPDGELGIIAACYRGKAVVQFEDGTGELYPGPDLKSREAPDQHPEPGPETGEIVTESPFDDDEIPEEITRAMLLDQARAAVEVTSSKAVFDALKEAVGVGKVKDIDPDGYPAAYKALQALQQVDA